MTRAALAATLLCLTCPFTIACHQAAQDEVESETVVPVVTEAATLGTIRAVIRATGTVAPAPGADLLVIPPEAARIAEIPRGEGDSVRRGDLLVRFEIPSLAADAASKRAEVTRAQARLENAKAAQTRAHELFDRGVAAHKEVEEADRELKAAEAAVPEAQAAHAASDTVAGRASVFATFDGIIARRTHNPGDMVDPSGADPVLRVIDPARLEVTAMIAIADVSRVVVGASAHIVDAPGETAVDLTVVSRPGVVQAGTGSVPIRLSFTRAATYAVGTPVVVAIDAEEHRNVVLVPQSAVVREGEETAVFVADGKKAHRRPVVIGLADATHAEVRSGVKAGDPVITQGQNGLPDDATVSVTPDKSAASGK